MIQRKIRIDLSSFDSDWAKIGNNDQDCYILLASVGFEEVLSFQNKMQKLVEKDGIKSADIFRSIEKFISDKFLGGIIYDSEIKKCRGLVKEDIKSFDMEVLNYIIGVLTGNLSKKV